MDTTPTRRPISAQEADTTDAGVAGRREFLGRMGMTGLGAGFAAVLLSGCGSGNGTASVPNAGATPTPTPTPSGSSTPMSDSDILNFALNLEYLETEYYLRGTTGSGLSSSEVGSSAGSVTGGRQVSFTDSGIQAILLEMAANERAHVNFIRSTLSSLGTTPISRPTLDYTNAFNAAALAAGLGSSFDPFANQTNFMIGAWMFCEVGVSAYAGAAALIQNKTVLEASAGILGVEAYHTGTLRHLLYDAGAFTQLNAISALRAQAGGGKDVGLGSSAQGIFVGADANSIAFERTPSEVLHIAYLKVGGTARNGGFFPNGVNGNVNLAS